MQENTTPPDLVINDALKARFKIFNVTADMQREVYKVKNPDTYIDDILSHWENLSDKERSAIAATVSAAATGKVNARLLLNTMSATEEEALYHQIRIGEFNDAILDRIIAAKLAADYVPGPSL